MSVCVCVCVTERTGCVTERQRETEIKWERDKETHHRIVHATDLRRTARKQTVSQQAITYSGVAKSDLYGVYARAPPWTPPPVREESERTCVCAWVGGGGAWVI